MIKIKTKDYITELNVHDVDKNEYELTIESIRTGRGSSCVVTGDVLLDKLCELVDFDFVSGE